MEYKIENDKLIVEFDSKGAECTRIYDKELGYEYLWNADSNYWGRHAPVLFPFVGRLKNDNYVYEDKEYHLGQHGFARDKEFKLFRETSEMISFYLEANAETKEVYPFEFRLKITYTLKDKELTVSYQIDNLQETGDLYASVGGHPAFNVPFIPNTKFEDYRFSIKNENEEIYKLPLDGAYIDEKNKVLVNKPLNEQITHDLFKDDALIYQTPGDTSIELYHKDHKNKIIMEYNTCDFVGIWSPYPKEAPFVCLEPWNGIADVNNATGKLEDKYKIQKIAPDNFFRTFYKIKFIEDEEK